MSRFRFAMILALLVGLGLPLRSSNVHPIAQITGTGAAVQVANSSARCRWVQIIADSGNTAAVWVGDGTVAVGVGLKIPAGGGYSTPTCDTCVYTPGSIWVYIANGDHVTGSWSE